MWVSYWLYYVLGIIMIPGIIFAMSCQIKVNKNYNKYSQIFSKKNIKSCDMARIVLDKAGLKNVEVKPCKGELSDFYDSRKKTVNISTKNYNSSSLAALGVTAHEIGHALQDQAGYLPMRIRAFLIPLTNFLNAFTIPLLILGMFMDFSVIIFGFSANIFIIIGICIFGLSLLIELITLPVEYNASKRTKSILLESRLLDDDEFGDVKKVLNSAALTYVASLLLSLLNFIRFFVWILMTFKHND